MKATLLKLLLLAGLGSAMAGCHHEAETPAPDRDPEELLPEQDAFIVSSLDTVNFTPSTIVLPNGQRLDAFMQQVAPAFYNGWRRPAGGACQPVGFDPQQYKTMGPQKSKNVFIGQLLLAGSHLVERKNFPGNGLGYSWGSEEPCKLQAPPGDGATCKDPMYGLDCSGLFRLMYKSAGVASISGDAQTLAKRLFKLSERVGEY